MKTTRLLHSLENQLAELAAQVAPMANHATLSPRFDRQLFRTRSTQMQSYLDEARSRFTELKQAVERQQLAQVAWLAEQLVAQIAAISRETATWSLRAWDSASPTLAAGSGDGYSIRSMNGACWPCATIARDGWRKPSALMTSNGWQRKLKPIPGASPAVAMRWKKLKTGWPA